MIDKDAKLNGNENICLHVAVKVGKSNVFRHFLYLERFCELFLHDVSNKNNNCSFLFSFYRNFSQISKLCLSKYVTRRLIK